MDEKETIWLAFLVVAIAIIGVIVHFMT